MPIPQGPVLAVFQGNSNAGSASTFPLAANGQPFWFQTPADIVIQKMNAATYAVSTLVLDVDYAVNMMAKSITLTAGPLPYGEILAAILKQSISQNEAFSMPVKGSYILSPNATTTSVNQPVCTPTSVVLPVAATDDATYDSTWITCFQGYFVVTHKSNSISDRKFDYVIHP